MPGEVFQVVAGPARRASINLIVLKAMTPNALAEYFDTILQAV